MKKYMAIGCCVIIVLALAITASAKRHAKGEAQVLPPASVMAPISERVAQLLMQVQPQVSLGLQHFNHQNLTVTINLQRMADGQILARLCLTGEPVPIHIEEGMIYGP